MDAYNSINNFLISLFQNVSAFGITEENKNQIEQFFVTILDTPDINAFKNPLLFQLILLLKREKNSNKVIDLLIEEIELKSVRVLFTSKNLLQESNETCCETPKTQAASSPEGTVGKRWITRPSSDKITLQKTEQDKRIELEKNINSIPVKIIFISIIFLILVLLIILLGPKYL